jgi:hypothetical protein
VSPRWRLRERRLVGATEPLQESAESASHSLGRFDMLQEVAPLSSRPGFISAREVTSLGPVRFMVGCFGSC